MRQIVDALSQIRKPGRDDRPIVFIDGDAEIKFLSWATKTGLLCKIELRHIEHASEINAIDPALFGGRRVFIAGSLFARHHMLWLERFDRERITVI